MAHLTKFISRRGGALLMGLTLMLSLLPVLAMAGAEAQIKVEQAKVEFSAGNHQGALDLLEAALVEEPENVEALHYAGLCRMGLGQAGPAAENFQKVVDLEPGRAGGYVDLAWALVEKNDFAGSLAAAGKALVLEPDNQDALFYKGLSLLGLKKFAEALPVFDRLAQTEAYGQAGSYYAGVCLINQGQTEQAAVRFDAAAAAGPDTALGQEAATYSLAIKGAGTPAASKPYGLRFRVLYQYDTNIVTVNDDTYLPEDVSNKEDGREVVDLDVYYNLVNEDQAKVQARYAGYASFHNQESEMNLMFHRGELSAHYDAKAGPVTIRTMGMGDYSMATLDGDPYSNNYKGTVGVGFHWSPALRTRVLADYLGETFDEPGEDINNRDNTGYQFTIYQHFFFQDGQVNTWVGYRYAQIMAEGDNYNRTDNTILAGAMTSLPNNSILYLIYRYEDRQFPDNAMDREETRNIANLAFQTRIYKSLNLYASVIYTGVDANLDQLEYERWIYTAGLLVEI